MQMHAKARAALKRVARDLNRLERDERRVRESTARFNRSVYDFMREAGVVGLRREQVRRIIDQMEAEELRRRAASA